MAGSVQERTAWRCHAPGEDFAPVEIPQAEPALALVFALIDTPDTRNVIHEGELIRALAFGEYLRSHARRLAYYAQSGKAFAGMAEKMGLVEGRLTRLKI